MLINNEYSIFSCILICYQGDKNLLLLSKPSSVVIVMKIYSIIEIDTISAKIFFIVIGFVKGKAPAY